MKITVEEITPPIARQMLELNRDNRSIRPDRVCAYSADMQAGRWLLTGEAIKITLDRLIDGQHRLLACVDADVSFQSVVVREVDPSAMDVLDSGLTRSMGDTLRFRSVAAANAVAACTRLVMSYDADHVGNNAWLNRNLTKSLMVKFAQDNEQALLTAHAFGTRIRTIGGMGVAGSAWWFIAARKHDAFEVSAFAERVVNGAGLLDGAPELTLRNWMAASGRLDRSSAVHLSAFIRAWNARVAGDSLKLMKPWSTGRLFPEAS